MVNIHSVSTCIRNLYFNIEFVINYGTNWLISIKIRISIMYMCNMSVHVYGKCDFIDFKY